MRNFENQTMFSSGTHILRSENDKMQDMRYQPVVLRKKPILTFKNQCAGSF